MIILTLIRLIVWIAIFSLQTTTLKKVLSKYHGILTTRQIFKVTYIALVISLLISTFSTFLGLLVLMASAVILFYTNKFDAIKNNWNSYEKFDKIKLIIVFATYALLIIL